jgi:hypothetical protein
VKYRSLESFRNDFRRLPAEHQQMFLQVLREFFLPAIAAGSFSGASPWPKRLRIRRLSDTEIYTNATAGTSEAYVNMHTAAM